MENKCKITVVPWTAKSVFYFSQLFFFRKVNNKELLLTKITQTWICKHIYMACINGLKRMACTNPSDRELTRGDGNWQEARQLYEITKICEMGLLRNICYLWYFLRFSPVNEKIIFIHVLLDLWTYSICSWFKIYL